MEAATGPVRRRSRRGAHISHAECCTAKSSRISDIQAARRRLTWSNIMGFMTEFFARPRPTEEQRYRSAMVLLGAMSGAERADINIKPADFPRIARQMAAR
ncbi:hypothetical protein EJC49_11120 [Aquibium carbonis]|uniref:Uncharacterized protein n=1 Tax=Aquibium carbonis TaxID=2495581 RepID=A0A3S0A791_9HYPH|nr:hypothetical protein [Aquibium carbonis]RST86316.1 hypothetical protein EJC49_11120 [Aquibium carbonis]